MKTTITLNQIFRNFCRLQRSCFSAVFLLLFLLSASSSWGQIAQRGTATTSTSTTSTVTVTKPTDLAVGDVMIATINQADNDDDTLANATLTDWILVSGNKYYETSNGDFEWWGTVLYKVATASDVSAANFTFTGDGDADDMQASIIAFSGVDQTNPIDVTGTFTSSSTDDTSLSANSITTTTDNAAVIMLAMISGKRNFNSNWSTTSPTSLTELFDVLFDSDTDMGIGGAWAIKSTAGATGNGTVTLSDKARDGAILIALKVAPGSIISTTFTSNGTFTVPNCVTSLTVEAWGGGGAGGGVTGNKASGGGGKGGSYVKRVDLPVSFNQSYTVTVGSGGTGGTGIGGSGGSSSFVNSGLSINVLAAGGNGGSAGSGASSAGSGATGTNGTNSGSTSPFSYNGGNGATGAHSSRGGGGGSSAGTGVDGNPGSTTNANGGAAPTGGGAGGNGFSGSGNEGNGNPATQVGGGGGGAVTDDDSDYSGGAGFSGNVVVKYTLPSNPTITLTNTTATACFSASAQDVTLAYSAPTGCPNKYSIDFASGITDVIDADLSGSSITIALPANLAAGNYTGTLTVRNSTYGFVSIVYTISITVNAPPPAVGAITGSNSVCVNQNSLVYSIEAVSNATNYTWTVPSGWSIVSGQGTTSITATAGSAGTGNITVQASNSCGSPQTEITITPVNATGNTGFVTKSGIISPTYTKSDNNIQANSGSQRGFIKFPLTAIPVGATILSSSLNLTNNNSTTLSSTFNDVKPLGNVDPVTSTAASLFSTIGAQDSGTIYSRETWSNTGVLNLSLNATAVADIQSRFASPGYIAMGLARGGTAIYNFFGYSNSTNSPKLIVNYTLPAGSLSVTVNALPTVNAGTAFTKTCVSNASGATIGETAVVGNTYSWSPSTGLSLATASNPTANPTTTTTYTVTKTNTASGCTATGTVIVTVNNSAISVNAGTAFTKTCVANTSGAAIGETAVAGNTYSWSPSTGLSSATASNPTANPTTTTTYTVTKTNTASGCTATGTVIVTVDNQAPTVTVSANQSICAGSSATITASGATSYVWSNSLGTASSVTVSPSTTTTYSVTGTGANGCNNTEETTITVNPIQTVLVSIAASQTTICSGTSVTFTATPTNGGTTPVYQWKVDGSNVGTNSATFTSSTLSNGNVVSCVMTSNATVCISGSPATSNTVTMVVNPILTASVSIAASETTICSGTSVTFTATPTNGGAAPSYQWKVNGTNAGTNAATFASTTLANNDVVTCEMTSNASPCLAGSPATSNGVTMVVNPILTASLSIAASETTICSGTSVTFTATPTNGGTTPSYQWKVNGTNAGTNAATFTSTTLSNNDLVSLVMTSNASPCLTGSPATSNTVTMTVNPNLPASVSVVSNVSLNTICSGTSVTFTATPTNGGASPSYQWKLNGSNVGTNSATYTSSTTLANGNTVSVEMTSTATCVTGSPVTSNVIAMIVSPLPCWTGANDTVWNDEANWAGGVPTDQTAVFISGTAPNQPQVQNGNAYANSINLLNNAVLTIKENAEIVVTNGITVPSTAQFIVENNANFVQINPDAVNSGTIKVKRNTRELQRLDYVLWSSPTEGTQTLKQFSPQTVNNRFYTYNSATNVYDVMGNVLVPFQKGKGYLIRTPNNHPTTSTVWSAEFNGVPNNGTITQQLPSPRAGNQNRYFLVGNPYASDINIMSFMQANEANINGIIYIFRKTNGAQISGYGSIKRNPDNVNDLLFTPNGNGNGGAQNPGGVIPSGQGFIVDMKVGASQVVFTNDMRVIDQPGVFNRTAQVTNNTISSNKFTLKLGRDNGEFTFADVGYFTNASNNYEPTYDVETMSDAALSVASIVENKRIVSQSRAAFDISDVVPLSIIINLAGNYKLSLDTIYGVFADNQIVYLRDNLMNTIHNLTEGSYSFASQMGTFDSRFEIIYQSPLAVSSPVVTSIVGSYTYNGSPQGPNAATNTGTGTSYTFIYEGTGSTTYAASSIAPTNEGTYTVTATVEAIGNYASASSSATAFTIEAATPVVTSTVGSYTYNGSSQGPNAATNTGTGTSYTFIYEGTGSTTYAASSIAPTNAGTYTVTATVEATVNYASASSSATAFTIEAATPVVTSTVGSYTYNGSSQGPNAATNSGIGTSYTFIYEGTGSTTYAASSIAPTNAGTYTVIATVEATVNYASASSSATPFTITAKPLTITALDYSKCVGVNYVLPSNGYSIEGLVGSQSIDNVTLSSTGNPSNSVVGTYPIVAQNAIGGTFNNSNYSITYIDGTLTVDPLSVGGTASASSNSVVSGNSTTITLTGYTGAIQWQSSNDGDSWTDEVGATQNTYTTPVLTQTVHYRALVTSGECSSVLSSSAVIAVDSAALAVPTFNESQVVIYKTPTNEISINTGNVLMSMVKIFDIRGRLLQEQKDINASQTFMNAVLTTEVLLVQITSEEGLVVTKKVLFPRTSLKLDKNLKAKTQLAEDE